MKLRIHRLAVAEIDHEVDDYESPCPLLPGLLSAALEKYAVRALALALEHVQVGERGGVEVRRGDRVLGDLAFVHWEDGKVADRHDDECGATRRQPIDGVGLFGAELEDELEAVFATILRFRPLGLQRS